MISLFTTRFGQAKGENLSNCKHHLAQYLKIQHDLGRQRGKIEVIVSTILRNISKYNKIWAGKEENLSNCKHHLAQHLKIQIQQDLGRQRGKN